MKPDCCLTGLSSTIRTQAYLEKRLGADFYKVPRATAVRILSVVRGAKRVCGQETVGEEARWPCAEKRWPCEKPKCPRTPTRKTEQHLRGQRQACQVCQVCTETARHQCDQSSERGESLGRRVEGSGLDGGHFYLFNFVINYLNMSSFS